MNPAIPKVSHYGVVRFGEIECEAVVLESGERGFVQRQFAQVLGFRQKSPSTQIRRFLGDFAPKALKELDKSGSSKVLMPHGGHAAFIPATAVTATVTGVIRAGVDGELHATQRPALDACLRMQESMASVGPRWSTASASGIAT